jgi:hypothetical protein
VSRAGLPAVRPGAVATFAYCLLGSVLLAFPLAAAWVRWAPRPDLVIRDGEVYYESGTEMLVGADMTFLVLAAGFGLLAAVLALLIWRRAGVELVIGTVVGGFVASLLAWRLGMSLVGGLTDDGRIAAEGRAVGEVFTGPLRLHAYGVLGIWSLVSVLVLAIVFSLRANRAGRKVRDLLAEAATASEPTGDRSGAAAGQPQ